MPRVETGNSNDAEIKQLEEEIQELDLKRIRAICEPEEKEPGITWLAYYTMLIKEKRTKLQELLNN